MASNRGPNAIGSSNNAVPVSAVQPTEEYYKAAQASAFQWAGGATSGPSASVGGSWGDKPAAVAVAVPPPSNGNYEKNLIAELCPPGGMKAEPPQEKLAEFARSVPSLNPDSVCPALLDALEEGNPWIMRAKALCVIETVLNVMTDVEGSHAYADFFYACSAEIAPLANHARAAVKGPAKRILTLLGVEGDGGVANGEASAAAAAVEPTVDAPNLLDFDEPAAVAAPLATPEPVPVAPQPSESNAGGSLFSGLSTKAPVPAAPAPTAPAPAAPVPAAPVPAAPEDDLLGGFGDIAPVSDAPSVTEAPFASSNDLFGGVSVKTAENGVANAPTVSFSCIDDLYSYFPKPSLVYLFHVSLASLCIAASSSSSRISLWFHEHYVFFYSTDRNTTDFIHTCCSNI